jgi:Ran GTPase-activating protein (RanGAP) involved in mRNA processing and transport
MVAEALGTTSNITYLDLSDNCGRRDPFGDHNFEGIRTLSIKLCQSFQLKTLKLARNGLWDDDFVVLFDAIAKMVNLQYVDVSGNHCGELGAEAVKNAMISHGVYIEAGYVSVDISLIVIAFASFSC